MPQASQEQITIKIFNLVNALNAEVLTTKHALKQDEQFIIFKITGIFLALAHVPITENKAISFHKEFLSEFNKIPVRERTEYFRDRIKITFDEILLILAQSLPSPDHGNYSNMSAQDKARDLYNNRIIFLLIAKEQAPDKSAIELHQVFREIAESRYGMPIVRLFHDENAAQILLQSRFIRDIFPEEAAFFDYRFNEDSLQNIAYCIVKSVEIRLKLIKTTYPYKEEVYKSTENYFSACHTLLVKQLNNALIESFNCTLAELYANDEAQRILKTNSPLFNNQEFIQLLKSRMQQQTTPSAASSSSSSPAASSSQFTTFSPKQDAYKQTAHDEDHQLKQQVNKLRNELPNMVDLYNEIMAGENYDGDMIKTIRLEKIKAHQNDDRKKMGDLDNLKMIWNHADPQLKDELIELASASRPNQP